MRVHKLWVMTLCALVQWAGAQSSGGGAEQIPLLRNAHDGTVEVVRGGVVVETYPWGTLVLTGPGRKTIEERRRAEAIAAAVARAEEADAEDAGKEAPVAGNNNAQPAAEGTGEQPPAPAVDERAAAEAAAAKRKEEQAAAKARQEKERADIKERAVSILDGITGNYVEVVPLDSLKQLNQGKHKTRQEQARLDEQAVSVYNKMTGGYVRAVPLEDLVPPVEER